MEVQMISFEVAKLAKEKGFETHIAYFDKAYGKKGERIPAMDIAKAPNKYKEEGYQCVEQNVLIKWLLDEHGVQVYAYSRTAQESVGQVRQWKDWIVCWQTTNLNDPRDEEYQTKEAALDFGLLWALKRL